MKNILFIIFIFSSTYVFSQPYTSKPGCAITVGTEYRIYQEAITQYNSKPTYQGVAVRYSTWTINSVGEDKTKYPCVTLNDSGSSGSCYVKTGTGTGSGSYTPGKTAVFTGSNYRETAPYACLPIDDYIPYLVLILGPLGFFIIKRYRMA